MFLTQVKPSQNNPQDNAKRMLCFSADFVVLVGSSRPVEVS